MDTVEFILRLLVVPGMLVIEVLSSREKSQNE